MKGSVLLDSIRIWNMRSLKDTGSIPLRPLTVLVGGNSSGKSTFLRTFPLIKQSLSKRTDGPILWAGDVDDYVDFGSFRETKGPAGKSIDLSFSFNLTRGNHLLFSAISREFNSPNPVTKVEYTISICPRPNRYGSGEDVSLLTLSLNNFTYTIRHSRSATTPYTLTLNGNNIPISNTSPSSMVSNFSHFFSLGYSSAHLFNFNLPNLDYIWADLSEFVFDNNNNIDFIEQYAIIDLISKSFASERDPITFLKEHYSVSRLKKNSDVLPPSIFTTFADRFNQASSAKKDIIRRNIALFLLYSAMPEIETYIRSYFENIHYIAPLRATAERFYRLRNLAVDEVDFQGKNIAVFLNSLTKDQFSEFQEWTKKHFGFVVLLSTKMQHISVKIARDKTLSGVNVSDSGFGYSQILPIIAELWLLSSSKASRNKTSCLTPIVIAIEQPELHLHPALQANLVDAFIACIENAKKHGADLQLIIETHSETIVNRIGRCIARGKIPSDYAEIVLFEKEYGKNYSTVSLSTYDDDGMLENWPIGFFEPEEI